MPFPPTKSLTRYAAAGMAAAAAALTLTATADAVVRGGGHAGGGRPAFHGGGHPGGGMMGHPGGGMMGRPGGGMMGHPGGGMAHPGGMGHPGGGMAGHPGGGMAGHPGGGRPGGAPGGGLHAGPGGGGLHAGPGPRNFSARPGAGGRTNVAHVSVGGHAFPLVRGRRFFWSGGGRHFFVPLATLGVVAIAGSYWYPDAFVPIYGPACTGVTPDGCQLEWRNVDFDDGGGAPQCVQYCPQAGPPPAVVSELPPPPPLAQDGNCQLTVYAEPQFGGQSEPTSENAPALSQSGWKDAISSIQVQSGTWDFFADEDYGGETLHLPAGTYPTLAPEWNKKIGSFMCVEPGTGPAPGSAGPAGAPPAPGKT